MWASRTEATEAGVGQGDRAAFAATAHGHEIAGPLRHRKQVGPAPHVGDGARRGNDGHQVAQLSPQWIQVSGSEIRVQAIQLGIIAQVVGHGASSLRVSDATTLERLWR
ncbi:hypothetical protein MTP03_03850 [Tsukamurella sp. PLM1]|nr:hypothetical protein MTP03_03850 [Tsukamurella sp. PLM1]